MMKNEDYKIKSVEHYNDLIKENKLEIVVYLAGSVACSAIAAGIFYNLTHDFNFYKFLPELGIGSAFSWLATYLVRLMIDAIGENLKLQQEKKEMMNAINDDVTKQGR